MRFITGFQEAKGYCPSLLEIANSLGFKSRSFSHPVVHDLIRRGHLRSPYVGRRVRALEVMRPAVIPRGPSGEPLYFIAIKNEGDDA